ncbi:MAG: amidohydrolase family protein [Nitrospinota bacterium]|nr:amidohydrolase family protein [Nitrospinota bacterium]MDP7505105.1 amidohydrolase family protein [Nitrospinota bacterium]
MAKTLIKNATIISMDPGIGDIEGGDILLDGDLIAEVGKLIEAPVAEVLDAEEMIVIPGLVNAHLHTWETALRGIGGDWAGREYFRIVHAGLAPVYTPEDTYLGNLMGALGQLHAGTTTIFDWCHNNATPAHSDAAIDALFEAGARAIFGHGTVKPDPKEGEPHYSRIPHPPGEIKRLRSGRLSGDEALVTMAMAILGPDYSTLEVTLHDFRLAREYGLLSSAHIWGTPDRLVEKGYFLLEKEGLLGPDHNVVHGNYLEEDELRVIVDSGASVTATPPVEMQKHPAESLTGRVLALGGRPSIGADIEIYDGGDMFHVMRFALQSQRIFDNQRFAASRQTGEKSILPARRALEWATINNAHALNLEDRIGSITPGKQADLVLIRTGDINMFPVNDAVQAVVFHAGRENVDTVFVAGRKVKEAAALNYPAASISRLKVKLEDSARRLLGAL